MTEMTEAKIREMVQELRKFPLYSCPACGDASYWGDLDLQCYNPECGWGVPPEVWRALNEGRYQS